MKRFAQIPSLSIGVEFECTIVPWEPNMLIGRLCHAPIDLSRFQMPYWLEGKHSLNYSE